MNTKRKMKENQEIELKSAFSVSENELIEFYRQAFNDRIKQLTIYWKWLNRTDYFDNKIPLVMEKNGKVIAHAGMIPFDISLNKNKYKAAWFIDFKILDEYQRQGLGGILTKEWVNYPDCCVTFCNHKSIGVFKKLGWQEVFNAYRTLIFVHMFDHPGFVRMLPKFIRKGLNFLIIPFLFTIYKTRAKTSQNYSISKLSDDSFLDFYELYKMKLQKDNTTSTIRDAAYAKWRILQSPNKERYHIYSTEDFKAVILIHNNHSMYIDVLWVSDNANELQIKRMIARLGIYGFKNNIAYIRVLTMRKNIADSLKIRIFTKVEYLRFAYYSKDKSIFEEMKATRFDFELIDSDFEHIK